MRPRVAALKVASGSPYKRDGTNRVKPKGAFHMKTKTFSIVPGMLFAQQSESFLDGNYLILPVLVLHLIKFSKIYIETSYMLLKPFSQLTLNSLDNSWCHTTLTHLFT